MVSKHLVIVCLGGLLMGLWHSPALFANVVSVKKKKGTVVVSDDGYSKGDRVCIYKGGSKKVACGKVRRISGGKAFVKVSKSRIGRIKPGMSARASGGGKKMGSRRSRQGSSGGGKIEARFSLMPALSTAATFNNISFNPLDPEAGEGPRESAWIQEDGAGIKPLIFGGEVMIPFGSMAGAVGFRLGLQDRELSSFSDYIISADAATQFVEVQEKESSLGFWALVYFYQVSMGGSTLYLGSGLDITTSNLSVVVAQKNDDGTEDNLIFDGKSSLQVISLPLAALLSFHATDSIRIYFGAKALIPVAGDTAGPEGDAITDEQVLATIDETVDPNADLQIAVAHQKSSFGLFGEIGVGFAF